MPGVTSAVAAMKRRLGRLWEGWKEIAGYVGDFQARLLLTIFYFTVAVPFGFLVRLVDPLHTKRPRGTSGWRPRPPHEAGLQDARRQF